MTEQRKEQDVESIEEEPNNWNSFTEWFQSGLYTGSQTLLVNSQPSMKAPLVILHDQLKLRESRSFLAFLICPVSSVYALSQSLKRITPNPNRPSKYAPSVMSTQKGRYGMISS